MNIVERTEKLKAARNLIRDVVEDMQANNEEGELYDLVIKASIQAGKAYLQHKRIRVSLPLLKEAE